MARSTSCWARSRKRPPRSAPATSAPCAKLQETSTGDTLCEKSKPIILKPIEFPDPVYSLAVKAKTKADEDKLGPGLQKLAEEDPTFQTSQRGGDQPDPDDAALARRTWTSWSSG